MWPWEIFAQDAYVKASNRGHGDYFSHRVALSGDTLAVEAVFGASNRTDINSANQKDNSALDAGAVYVFG